MGRPELLSSASMSHTQNIRAKTLPLKKGQVFEGKVLKLFPNQTAALRLGSINVTARLEAALSAGKHYLFQVKQNEGIPRLQVLDTKHSSVRNSSGSIETANVLQALGLSENKQNQTMLRMLLAEQIPFSKEIIEEGGKILKNANALDQDGIRILAAMSQKQFPMTPQTFQALYQVENGAPLSSQMQELSSRIDGMTEKTTSPSAVQAAATLQKQLTKTMEIASMNGPVNGESGHKLVQQLLQLTVSSQTPVTVKDGAAALLQKTGLVPESTGSISWLDSFKNTILHPSNRTVIQQLWPSITEGEKIPLSSLESKELFQTLMNRLSFQEGESGRQQMNQLLSLFQQAEGRSRRVDLTAGQLSRTIQGMQEMPLSSQEKQALTVIVQGSFSNQSAGAQGMSSVAGQLTKLLVQLGFQHESDLSLTNAQSETNEAAKDQLKQSLLQHIPQLPASARESAEALLYRLTGQQLLAQDQQGPIQQAALQFPLVLGDYHTDLTVQWEGRKQEDGQLHPDHCRILFYLEMERLGETIADVQIQNRFVTVNIFNDNEKPILLMELLQPFLKERLNEHQYMLSSVNWKRLQDSASTKQRNAYQPYTQSRGVDVRI
ncbi:hypothetical protein [Alteribacillus sp. YIM 98480]|uniref:hypothetical protein n=1 Tax=Alteribacillus sp. YIM 98480 TaxID=2606599 RepID=UPI00131D8146|nr:hypothetical protein [Alteribacillus sp. YIM 98480]